MALDSIRDLQWLHGIKLNVTCNNITIYDSYKFKGKVLKRVILEDIMNTIEYKATNKHRSLKSYLREWQAHNVLYNLGIARKRTVNTDLNEDESKLRRFCYFILSLFQD